MTLLRDAAVIAVKDLRIEVRRRQAAGTVLPFAGTLLLAFGFAFGPGRAALRAVAPGMLWIAVLFAAVLVCRGAYEIEAEDDALHGILLTTVDRAAIFLGKTGAALVQLLALEVVLTLLVVGLFDVGPGRDPLTLAAAAVLGSLGLAAVGCLFGVLTVSARAREAVFPLLVLPLASPVLIAAVRATTLAMSGRGGAGSWLGLLGAFDAVFVSLGLLVFGYLMED